MVISSYANGHTSQLHDHRSRQECPITVVVSEASLMSCELIHDALKRTHAFNIVSCATSSDVLIEAVNSGKPDVALISVTLSDGAYAGLKVLRKLHSMAAPTKCVMVIDSPDRELVVSAFRSGARGIFCRSSSPQLLTRCIVCVHAGQLWVSSTELEYLVDAFKGAAQLNCVNSMGDPLLTPREQELLPLVANGLTNLEIAERLNISEHTVKNHLFRVYEKLGISSRVELILYASSKQATADEPAEQPIRMSASLGRPSRVGGQTRSRSASVASQK